MRTNTRRRRTSTSTCVPSTAKSGCASATTGSVSILKASPSGKNRGVPGWGSSECGNAPRCCAERSKSTRHRSRALRSSPNYHWRTAMQVERRPIRVMLVEDHNLVRAGIRAVIDGQSDIQVIAEATEGREAIRLARANCPDVAVVDVAMPNMSGIEVTREIRRLCPQTQVLILTAHDNEEYFFQTLKAGAVGYVLKKAAASDLIAAIEAASKGEPYLYPSVARLLVSDYLQRAPERETFEPLSDRERPLPHHQNGADAPRSHHEEVAHARSHRAGQVRHPKGADRGGQLGRDLDRQSQVEEASDVSNFHINTSPDRSR